MGDIEELLTRGVANIVPGKDQIGELLRSEKKLNIYLGIDPTSTRIHLGHAVQLRKLQAFANLGHNVTFLIGDFTAMIGDTSDKDSERPTLTTEEIQQNFQTYKKQAEKIIDFSKVQIRYNSEWLDKVTFKQILEICTNIFSLNDFISRELIKKRLDSGTRVGLQELLYPVMQAYDSYKLDTDIQIGGTDQTFNIQAGRTLLKRLSNKESYVLTTPILEGTDGRKMSKSWGNAIWLDDSPEDMYAKVMAINDDLVIQYYTLATNVSMQKVDEIKSLIERGEHPMSLKKDLAYEIVFGLHGSQEADKAKLEFEKRVQQKEKPEEMRTVSAYEAFDFQKSMSINDAIKEGRVITDVLVGAKLAASKSDAKRLVEQGGVEVNDVRITDPRQTVNFTNGMIIKVGKRNFVQINFGESIENNQ